ncbi:MAG: hypothetical protein PHZ19_02765 [Candidatus Thermoplasmatota archaeon]|nr:hypothetical protein [Candidatus Thermoplasmatota archaeon]
MDERVVTLPIGYNVDGKIYKNVVLRPLSGRALLEARGKIGERVDPSLFVDLLRSVVVRVEDLDAPFRPDLMYFVDADFIFYQLALWEHEMSGDKMMVQRQCTVCQKSVKFEIRESDVTVKPVEATEWGKYPDLQIPFKLRVPIKTLDPDGKPYDTGKIRLLTLADEVEKFKRYGDSPGRMWSETVRMMISQLGPKSYGSIFPADFDQLPAYEIKKIEQIYASNMPGVEAPSELICPSCQGQSQVNPAIMWVPDFLLLPSGG